MDHQTALSTQAVERYTLDELTSPEREEFEDHYFSCAECTAALREYDIFAANARAVFTEDEARASQAMAPIKQAWWSKWFGMPAWAPALAALALAFVLIRNPSGETASWTLEQVRDETPHHVISKKTAWLEPSIELVTGKNPNRWDSFHWEVLDDNGKVVEQNNEHNGKGMWPFKLHASRFESGKKYKLVVMGDPANGPITSSFVIDRQ